MGEIQLALQRGVSREGGATILPVILADADVPPLLREFPWIDLRDGNVENAVGQLVRRLERGRPVRPARPEHRGVRELARWRAW